MPRLLTALERRAAAQGREFARQRAARLRRFLRRPDLSPAVREQATAEIDDLERECAMLGMLLSAESRTGWTWARFASEHDSLEERPYQDGAA